MKSDNTWDLGTVGEKKNLPGQGSSELVHSEGQGTAVEGEELLAGA